MEYKSVADELRQVVQRVRDSVDLVELIGRTVDLKRVSGRFKGLCPFHQEKTPSFTVDPVKGYYKCFGCGAGGSAFDFVMNTEKLTFFEALEKLAAEKGIELPSRRPSDQLRRDEEKKQQEAIIAANEEALRFFRKSLKEGKNPLATDYLPKRGLSPEICDRFQIGASVDAWDALKLHLLGKGFSENLLVEAGLCTRSESGRVYDSFRNRLMFPILDINGRPVGFGGRQLVDDPQSGKYINSKETLLYKKSRILYALNLARQEIQRSGYVILCEGYMDVIMLHVYGHRQAVASLGTALTEEHARLIKHQASRVYFLYDGDTAGRSNMLKGGAHLLSAGLDIRVIELPQGDDPDSFLRREGSEALFRTIESAREFFDFAIRQHGLGLDMATISGQAELVERIVPMIGLLKNEVMREAAITRLLQKIPSIPREAIDRVIVKKAYSQNGATPAIQSERTRPKAQFVIDQSPEDKLLARYDRQDLALLRLMLDDHGALDLIRSELREDWLIDSRIRPWITHLLDHHEYPDRLIREMEIRQEYAGEYTVLTDVLAIDLPDIAKGVESARQLLRRIHERHQQAITQELYRMLDSPTMAEEDRLKLLTALTQENRNRLQQSGRHLRAGDLKARIERYGPPKRR